MGDRAQGGARREGLGFQVSPEPFLVLQGATDSEKRVQHLTLENEALKQSLTLTRDLLRHWGPGPRARAPQVFSLAAIVPAVWGSCSTAQASLGPRDHCNRGWDPDCVQAQRWFSQDSPIKETDAHGRISPHTLWSSDPRRARELGKEPCVDS